MTKLFKTLSVMIVVATTGALAGCDLYFGDPNGGSSSSGGGGSVGTPTGSDECNTNNDCAAGCFCSTGTCTESGFCGSDADCGSGYTCDVARSTCEPGKPTPTCGSNADCADGTVCDASTGACDATCSCTDDTDATDAGYGWCDTTRDTCMTGENPAGTCTAPVGVGSDGGSASCSTTEPKCPDNQVPLVLDGCYTGSCLAIASCEGAPACTELQHEDDCLSRSADCGAVYTGEDCTTKSGTACVAGDTGCTCATFTFNSCATKPN